MKCKSWGTKCTLGCYEAAVLKRVCDLNTFRGVLSKFLKISLQQLGIFLTISIDLKWIRGRG